MEREYLPVVGCIDEDFVEYLIQRWNIYDTLMHHSFVAFAVEKGGVFCRLGGAHVLTHRKRPEKTPERTRTEKGNCRRRCEGKVKRKEERKSNRGNATATVTATANYHTNEEAAETK